MSSKITEINEFHTKHIVEALREILRAAEEGKLRGIAFTIKTGPRHHEFALLGDYWKDPHDALACMGRMHYKINQLIAAREGSPDTGHMPLL